MGKTEQVRGSTRNLRVVKGFFKRTTRGKVDASLEQIRAQMAEKMCALEADNFEIYFTDGSISDNVSSTAFVHPKSNTVKSWYTLRKLSSMFAELLAIARALEYAGGYSDR